MIEKFVEIIGYGGDYQISNTGKIKSIKRKHVTKTFIMKPSPNADGYMITTLRRNGKSNPVRIARLVASHFLDKPSLNHEVNHIDSDRTNDNLSNLEWVTHRENIIHSHKSGSASNVGLKNPRCRNSENDVHVVCELLTHIKPAMIMNTFGYGRDFVLNIFHKKNWKSISDSYDFLEGYRYE